MIIDEVIERVKETAQIALGSGEPFHPMLNTIKNGKEHLVIIAPAFEDSEKDNIYSIMSVAANLDEPEAIIFTSDTRILRVGEDDSFMGIDNPIDSPFAENALMILVVSEDEVRTLLNIYAINDDGSITFRNEEEISSGWRSGELSDLLEAALVLDKEGLEEDYGERLYGFMKAYGFDILVLEE